MDRPVVLTTIYPYDHRCWCGTTWKVSEENAAQHEVEVQLHRASHKAEKKK